MGCALILSVYPVAPGQGPLFLNPSVTANFLPNAELQDRRTSLWGHKMAAETRLPDRGAAPRSSHLPRGQSPNKQLGPLRIWRRVLSLESGHQPAACVCLCFLSHLLSRSLFQERPKSGGRNAGQGVGMFGSWFCTAAMGKCRWRTKKGPSQSSAGATARGYLASCPFSAPLQFS